MALVKYNCTLLLLLLMTNYKSASILDGYVSNTTSGSVVIPIYSLVSRTNSQLVQQTPPRLTNAEPRDKEIQIIDQTHKVVRKQLTADDFRNMSDCSRDSVSNVRDQSQQTYAKQNESRPPNRLVNNIGRRDGFNEDFGYETLPDVLDVFPIDLSQSMRAFTSQEVNDKDSKLTTNSATVADQSLGTKRKTKKGSGPRRRGKSDEETSKQGKATCASVQRSNSWAQCDLMQLPHQLTAESPVFYTTAV